MESVTLPSQKGRLLRAKVLCATPSGSDLLFEPDHNLLAPLGTNAEESVVATSEREKCGSQSTITSV